MSIYLETNYAPVQGEVTAFDLPVIGELPKDLEGRYLRNGPNPIAEVNPLTHHWFTGDGMVHGIRLRGGRAEWYRNRYIGSDAVAEHFGRPISGPNWSGGGGGPNTNVGGFAGYRQIECGHLAMDGGVVGLKVHVHRTSSPSGFCTNAVAITPLWKHGAARRAQRQAELPR